MGKKWSRKRKADQKAEKAGSKSRRNNNNNTKHGTNKQYTIVQYSNPKFEAYYSMIGLHNTKYDNATQQFIPCTSDNEKHTERNQFMSTMSSILPASFRVDRSLDAKIQATVLSELNEFVGKEMELEIELPTRSTAFGGMKNILDNGKDVTVAVAAPSAANDDDDANQQDMSTSDDKKPSEEEKKKDGSNNKNNYKQPVIVKKTIAPAKPIPFIESNSITLGYQLSIDRRTIRRNKSLEPFHTWLKIQTDCGHITRQETVSMIPPVVLNAKEGMSILDVCAAPGSKTCQLLEVVGGLKSSGGGEDNKNEDEYELEPKGYVVANDADAKRAYMLVNQLRRMNSPSVFVTSCDGQYFPILDAKSDKGTMNEGTFDRVLCDVPCSGDGTVRKNPGIWKRWSQMGSLALHPLQLSIALRGARLTKVGGYMVYSTCSLNPMENESVVAELLRIGNGALVLEDPRDRMTGLVARPGWSYWKVLREKGRTGKEKKNYKKKRNAKMEAKRREYEEKVAKGECPPPKESESSKDKKDDNDDEEEYIKSPYATIPYVPPATWDDAALSERTASLGFVEYATYNDVEDEWKRRVRSSCFPPTDEEATQFELQKSLRCLPQDMDTGGFYVALLKKVKPLPTNAMERMKALARESKGGGEVEAHLTCNDKDGEEKKIDATESVDAKSTDDKTKEDEDEPIEKAPQGKVGMQNNKKDKKNAQGHEDFLPMDPSIWNDIVEEYGLTDTFPKEQFMVRAASENKKLYFITKSIKENLIDQGIQDRITVINSGLKGFERCSMGDSNRYRLAQEAVHYIVPHMTKRIVSANMDDFYTCNNTGFIEFAKFGEEFVKQVETLSQGSFLVTLKGYEKDMSKKMFLVMWKRPKCVNCFVTKIEIEAIKSKMRALGYVAKDEMASEEKKADEGENPKEKAAEDDKMDTSSSK